MNNEQPEGVGAGTKSCGVRTSVNKEYWKSEAASNSPVYSLRGIRAYDELQIVVTEVEQVKQTVTMYLLICLLIHSLIHSSTYLLIFLFIYLFTEESLDFLLGREIFYSTKISSRALGAGGGAHGLLCGMYRETGSTNHDGAHRANFASPFHLSPSSPSIPLSRLLSNILDHCPSLGVTDQVSHPYNIKANIIHNNTY